MSKPILFTGSGVALVTPMYPDGRINYGKLEELVDWHVEMGTDALIVCGTTGEAPTLKMDEHLEAIRVAVARAAGRIPVIAGTGSNDTDHCINSCREAKRLGADGLLLVTPYYNKTSQRGLVAHYTTVASATDLPLILYNVPSRTGLDIKPETMAQMYRDIDTVVGLKQASPDMAATAKLAAISEVPIYSGNDDLTVPVMALGGLGVITVLGNVAPAITRDICRLWLDGNTDASRALFLQWMDLAQGLFTDVNPIPVKEAMNRMGMEVGDCRLPLYTMEPAAADKLADLLRRHGLVK
ncbi:MAG: 4-hydroxy-tetrahydrodipicolinate synthase [Clostridia bacterium]|nr:4-hydroxy-tetrahydrodipicolinate synthase [Clostridia bacterium]